MHNATVTDVARILERAREAALPGREAAVCNAVWSSSARCCNGRRQNLAAASTWSPPSRSRRFEFSRVRIDGGALSRGGRPWAAASSATASHSRRATIAAGTSSNPATSSRAVDPAAARADGSGLYGADGARPTAAQRRQPGRERLGGLLAARDPRAPSVAAPARP